MNKRFMFLSIAVSDLWFGAYWLNEHCKAGDWWMLPSLLTVVGIFVFSWFAMMDA